MMHSSWGRRKILKNPLNWNLCLYSFWLRLPSQRESLSKLSNTCNPALHWPLSFACSIIFGRWLRAKREMRKKSCTNWISTLKSGKFSMKKFFNICGFSEDFPRIFIIAQTPSQGGEWNRKTSIKWSAPESQNSEINASWTRQHRFTDDKYLTSSCILHKRLAGATQYTHRLHLFSM